MTMLTWSRAALGIPTLCFLLLAAPHPSRAQESPTLVAVGAPTGASTLEFLVPTGELVFVSPSLPPTATRSVGPFEAHLSQADAAALFSSTQASALLRVEADPEAPSRLSFIPFEAHEATRDQDWSRVVVGLDDRDLYTLVTPHGTTSDLSRDELKTYWDDLFRRVPAVRALGLSGAVYLEPVGRETSSQKAVERMDLVDTLDISEGVLKGPQWPRYVDGVFSAVVADEASSDEVSWLQAVWTADLRSVFDDQEGFSGREARKIGEFLAVLRGVVESPTSPWNCLVAVSTVPTADARIMYHKSLSQQEPMFFGTSTAHYPLERARWTFISQRRVDSEWRETGRKSVTIGEPSGGVCEVTIQEED